MESELSPDKEIPPVPIKTYQWEDLKRARDAGGYPWTHLLKPPLEGEITADDIIRESTPRRSMSREFSRSRTRSPADGDEQKILNLDSSPGSSRKHGEDGEDEGVHIPSFSHEVSLDSEEDNINQAVNAYVAENSSGSKLTTPSEPPKNISPKGILKRRVPEQQYIGVSETREKTKCCHPLVNKIKHLADKTLQKLEGEKSPSSKRKKNEENQEIRQLKTSPGAVRRQKFGAIKLGDSDEMSKSLSVDATAPSRKKKEHIYEDIEESKSQNEKSLKFTPDTEDSRDKKDTGSTKENDSLSEKKSLASQDPSLVNDETTELSPEEHIMEKLHQKEDKRKEAVLLEDSYDDDEPNVDEVFRNQFDEQGKEDGSPNITITEIIDDDTVLVEETTAIIVESSPSPREEFTRKLNTDPQGNWSKTSSDHEYEIIEKPPPDITFTTSPTADSLNATMLKAEDELSSTTSLERKYLQHTSDEDDQEEKENMDRRNDNTTSAEALQKDIEERFFVNTPSTISRTECEVSTSHVDSSALEHLPLKRDSRSKIKEQKSGEGIDVKIQQRLREGTGKLKTQAGKLKTKLQNIKTKQFSMPERPKINFPDRPKFKMPERPKFTLPDKRKFSLPDRPKFKKINISEKLSLGDRKKFTMPERPKFNVPDMPKFKFPDRPKINFASLGRKKEYKVNSDLTGSGSDLQNTATVEFETKTFPRLFGRKKKSETLTSSSPTLNREPTPPPIFTFARVKKSEKKPDDIVNDQPREYGSNINDPDSEFIHAKHFETTYDFDKVCDEEMEMEEEIETPPDFHEDHKSASTSDMSPSKQEYNQNTINEIDNDEFFVRPRGISRENIEVREYLSDEIRQAFKIPKNALAMMGDNSGDHDDLAYENDEADPELMLEENEPTRYSTEDLNDRDDGYYTFPPVRPSRAKRKKKELETTAQIENDVMYIDENTEVQMSELELNEHPEFKELQTEEIIQSPVEEQANIQLEAVKPILNEYENEDIGNGEINQFHSQTLPLPPRRKRKSIQKDFQHSSLIDLQPTEEWRSMIEPEDDIIVYRTEHEYVIPQSETVITENSPIVPRRSRNRSRSSHGTSLCDDDRTSHGADSLTLDTHITHVEDSYFPRESRQESPGYATVDKGQNAAEKPPRRSKSKTPPVRRRKSNSSERKYYTVGSTKSLPNRPPRKKSSTSLMTLGSITKRSLSSDTTQYVEIDEVKSADDSHKDLVSGDVVNKMKDRPLPPPPRPPRGSKSKKKSQDSNSSEQLAENKPELAEDIAKTDDIVEIEVSTQTDPLPDDVDYELGLEENLDFSVSSSIRDDDEQSTHKSSSKLGDRSSRPTSRTSQKLSDPKISEISKSNIGRTSPTVILVERRVSSPTRIKDREEMLTEASLTVQHIDVEESQIPEVPPLPTSRGKSSKTKNLPTSDDSALERVTESNREVQLDNLITQRLQVNDLDVGRLNVSELQASKILVSDIEGMTLQVTELDSKSGHISVSGIEFSQNVIDEIVKKFSELSSTNTSLPQAQLSEIVRPMSRSEETQTDDGVVETETTKDENSATTSPPSKPATTEETPPPQRPPPPDLTPLLYSYLQDMAIPPAGSLYHVRSPRERPFTEFHESQHQSPPAPTRRAKRRPTAPPTESSSEDSKPRPSPRRMPPPARLQEPSIAEAGAQFLRVCQNSVSRTMRNMFHSFMTYISGTEDKRDVQMALVIFLVLIAGLMMFGLSDSRTVHHHHWEFFNPPDGKPT